jgi:hypothetical protein
VNTFNALTVTTNNIIVSPIGGIDFESVLLHEVGHSLGLAHTNRGGSGAASEYTLARLGGNGVFDDNPGVDGIIGTADDIRGDDVNLNYFKIADNNPFTIAGTVDSTTYSRVLADLPGGDNYSANSGRDVAAALGVANTEGVMQQGTFFNELQRTLAADDVAGLRYAMTGLDNIFGTADDYQINLVYTGQTTAADILIDFDDAETGFAVSRSSGTFLSGDNIGITNNDVYFNTGFTWVFNDVSNSVVPEPSSAVLLMGGFMMLFFRRSRLR